MNQFFSQSTIKLYKSVICDTVKQYYNKLYLTLFSIVEIKPISHKELFPYSTYLTYIYLKTIGTIELIELIGSIDLDYKSDYYIKLYNKNGLVKAICKNCSLKHIYNICQNLGINKFNGMCGNKCISKVLLDNIDITHILIDFNLQNQEYITLKEILDCESVKYSFNSIISITYIDFDNFDNFDGLNNLYDDPEITILGKFNDFQNNSIDKLI